MARPTLLTEDMKKELEAAAEAVYHYKYIAGLSGIHRSTLDRWLDEDKDLATRLYQARSRFIKNHMRKAKPDFMLQTADREIFADRKTIVVENPQAMLLEAYGVTENGKLIEEGEDDTKADEDKAD